MPQMAPLSWVLLFMFFSLSLIMINILNYFLFTPKFSIHKTDKKISSQKQDWKW